MEIPREYWYGFLILAVIAVIAIITWRKTKKPTSRGIERELQRKRDEQSSKYYD